MKDTSLSSLTNFNLHKFAVALFKFLMCRISNMFDVCHLGLSSQHGLQVVHCNVDNTNRYFAQKERK